MEIECKLLLSVVLFGKHGLFTHYRSILGQGIGENAGGEWPKLIRSSNAHVLAFCERTRTATQRMSLVRTARKGLGFS
jgi:hypothetical protein